MINTSLYTDIEKDKKKMQATSRPEYATVIEVTEEGVKIRIDGEEDPRSTYYDSLAIVNVGDRVCIKHTSGDVLIMGKLHYWKGGRGNG